MNNNNTTIDRVLVVTDVQNCFIKGGSFGRHNQNLTDLELSIEQSKEIEMLIGKNNNIIFTRDFHPINHLSIGNNKKIAINSAVTWPSHCLNRGSECPRNNNEKIIKSKNSHTIPIITIKNYIEKYSNKLEKNDSSILNTSMLNNSMSGKIIEKLPIIGTNISFLMYMTKYAPEIISLIIGNRPIGILPSETKSTDPNFELINNNPYIVENNKKKFIQLVKGQYCKYESYSAFNYHLKLSKKIERNEEKRMLFKGNYITSTYLNNANKANNAKNPQDLSTGLFEYILKTPKKNIEITVCGLVGEVCVINTVVEGLILWHNFYNKINGTGKKVTFNYSLAGTLFIGNYSPFGFKDEKQIPSTFIDLMKIYLNDNVDKKYRECINFNVLDYEGKKIGKFEYNKSPETGAYEIIYVNKVNANKAATNKAATNRALETKNSESTKHRLNMAK